MGFASSKGSNNFQVVFGKGQKLKSREVRKSKIDKIAFQIKNFNFKLYLQHRPQTAWKGISIVCCPTLFFSDTLGQHPPATPPSDICDQAPPNTLQRHPHQQHPGRHFPATDPQILRSLTPRLEARTPIGKTIWGKMVAAVTICSSRARKKQAAVLGSLILKPSVYCLLSGFPAAYGQDPASADIANIPVRCLKHHKWCRNSTLNNSMITPICYFGNLP